MTEKRVFMLSLRNTKTSESKVGLLHLVNMAMVEVNSCSGHTNHLQARMRIACFSSVSSQKSSSVPSQGRTKRYIAGPRQIGMASLQTAFSKVFSTHLKVYCSLHYECSGGLPPCLLESKINALWIELSVGIG